MNVEKLLKPRFKVIANYPKSFYKIGEIIDTGYELIYCDTHGAKFTDYPHLFKKLNWWERREEGDMPKYLKHQMDITTENWNYDIIESWDMKNLVGWLNEKERTCCSLLSWNPKYGYFPATKEEYENYIANS